MIQTRRRIDLNREVNPVFAPVWYSDRPYNILHGGRNSFKSSTVSLKLASMAMDFMSKGEWANFVVIRKTATTIRDSVFTKIQWSLSRFGIFDRFRVQLAPYRIVDPSTGTGFYFYGQDDFEKLKSNDIGNVVAVWYEEATEFHSVEEFDQTNITFMRQKHPMVDFVQFYWTYNAPRNRFSWINEWAASRESDPDYLVHHSTYLDDQLGFVTEQMKADIERVRHYDPDYYRFLYLGESVGLGTDVYNFSLFQPVEKPPREDPLRYLAYGLDVGHQQSATACLAVGVSHRGNVYILDCFYYDPSGQVRKAAPDELAAAIHQFVERTTREWGLPVYRRTIDSAEGALRNQYFKDYGERWNPVPKSKKVTMIDYVVTLLAQGRVFYRDCPAMEPFVTQHKNYRWDERTVQSDNPSVIKEEDHCPDAFQYFVNDNLRELSLIW